MNCTNKELNMISINVTEIMELIPHRYPFLLIDRVDDAILGESATGIKNVTMNEWYFQGHFPSHPIMPGVVIVESMAQTAGVLVVKTVREMMKNQTKALFDKENKQENNKVNQENYDESNHQVVYFMTIESAKFRKPVVPGCTLRLKVKKEKSRGNIWKFKGEAFDGESLMAEAVFSAKIS